MRPLSNYKGNILTVSIISFWKRIYELKFNEETLAKLYFPKKLSSQAIVEGFEGKWEIKQDSIWKRDLSIYKFGYHLPFSNYTGTFWGHKGQLKLTRGNNLNFKFGIFKKACSVFTTSNVLLFEFKNKFSLKDKAEITLARESLILDENPWVIMLAWYLILVNKKQAAHAG